MPRRSSRRRSRRLRALLVLLAGCVGLAAGAALYATDALRRLELLTVDMRFDARGAQPPPEDIVVVGIDARTFSDYPFVTYPLPRRLHARVIDRLVDAGARVIAYDIQFTERSSSERDDIRLVDAVAGAKNRIVLATTETDGRGPHEGARRRRPAARDRRPGRQRGHARGCQRGHPADAVRGRRPARVRGRRGRARDQAPRPGVRGRRGLDRLPRAARDAHAVLVLARRARQGAGLGVPRQDRGRGSGGAVAAGRRGDLDLRRGADERARDPGRGDLDDPARAPAPGHAALGRLAADARPRLDPGAGRPVAGAAARLPALDRRRGVVRGRPRGQRSARAGSCRWSLRSPRWR